MPRRSSEETWFETAEDHLRAAKDNFRLRNYAIAYSEAIYCGETALKAILVKCGIFDPKEDRIHDQVKLLNRIKRNNCLPSNLVNPIENIIHDVGSRRGLPYVDVSHGLDHINCTAHAPYLRYPGGGSTPYEMVSLSDAQEKIDLAEKLLKLLDIFIGDLN